MQKQPTDPEVCLACEDATTLVADYVRNELTEEERGRLEAHLDSCPACQDRVAFERRLASKLRALREVTVPTRLERRVRRIIPAGEERE